MRYSVKLLADSFATTTEVRLTTLEIVLPRFLLAELNTHRMFSRNSASSRAKKPEDVIQQVLDHPFVPTMNKRVKGMGVGDPLSEKDAKAALAQWLAARDAAVAAAQTLVYLDCDKSRINRLLEPFMWHTAIVSATEWDNFFGLRDHPAAQPEFQIIASMMQAALNNCTPNELSSKHWHLPLITEKERISTRLDPERAKMISAGRCARVSYDTHENFETHDASIGRAEILMGNGHWSPFEHVARPWTYDEAEQRAQVKDTYIAECQMQGVLFYPHKLDQFNFEGNFRGWKQMRKEIPHESNFALM